MTQTFIVWWKWTKRPSATNGRVSSCFFAEPLLACGFLHLQTIRGLLDMKSNQEQNKSLTFSIMDSWVAWVLCCLPDFLVGSVKIILGMYYKELFIAETVSVIARQLYIQVNPFLIIAVYAPFRKEVSRGVVDYFGSNLY